MELEDTPPISGSNSMCVSTVLLETGIILMQEPITHMVLEPPGGLIEVVATCKDGKVTEVSVRNVPSFVDQMEKPLEVEGVGTITVSTAYSGDSLVIADASELGFNLQPDEARDVAEARIKITRAANEQLGFFHPENPDWAHISFCQLAAPVQKEGDAFVGRNTVVIQPEKLDRCPTGTGCSARMALLHAQGVMKTGD